MAQQQQQQRQRDQQRQPQRQQQQQQRQGLTDSVIEGLTTSAAVFPQAMDSLDAIKDTSCHENPGLVLV